MSWFNLSRSTSLSRRSLEEHVPLPQEDWDEEFSSGPDGPDDSDEHDGFQASHYANCHPDHRSSRSRPDRHAIQQSRGLGSASSSSSSSSSPSGASASFLCASPGSARRRRLSTAASTLLVIGVGASLAGLSFLADDSRRLCNASSDRHHTSCYFSPRHMLELLKDMYFQCNGDSIACGVQCMSPTSGEVCCPNNLGGATVCSAGSECCDGLCAAAGTMCADVCAPGLISCGGTCLLGSPKDTCCLGPSGAGIVCGPDAECCEGLCMEKGQGCARQCAPGLVSCGGVCLPGNSSDQCCLGPTGAGILCEASAECCGGVCFQDGQGCAKHCAPGTVHCGGLCLPGQDTDICCMGPSGSGILCESEAECCAGICVAGGQGCSTPCDEGLVKCGGLCLPGAPDAQCCLGQDGVGILCGPNATCCDGLCMMEGQGCSKTCAEGLIPCGGECLPGLAPLGDPAAGALSSCCVGPEGHGILCGADAECCDGVCLAKGHGCAEACAEGLVKCGGTCLPGLETDQCCLNSEGVGLLCSADAQCCDGLCVAPGTSCAGTACGRGTMRCGNECLLGDPDKDQCCMGPEGLGIICEGNAQCCDGLCFEPGEGCAMHCREGTIECGGLCLPAEEGAICCTGSRQASSHDGKRANSSRQTNSRQTNSSSNSSSDQPPIAGGVVCSAGSVCCDGLCVLEGAGCGAEAEVCDPGLTPCAGACLPMVAGGSCCTGSFGAGTICHPEQECCGGVCKAKGTPCDLPIAI